MRITISIPKPCHEDWQAMTPNADTTAGKGRHCAQCDHVVTDLTRATDAQLIALFTSEAKPKCARFDPAQLDRVLGREEPPRNNALPLAAFTTLVAIATGQEAMAQGGPVVRPAVMLGEPAIAQPAPPPPKLIGKVMPMPHPRPPACETPIIGDTVIVTPDDEIIQRIELGNVSVRPDPYVGSFGGPEIIYVPDTVEVCGTVVDDRSGEPIPFAQIWSDDLDAHTTTDVDGAFRFHVPCPSAELPVSIEVRSPGYLFQKHTIDPDHRAEDPSAFEASTAPLTGPIDPRDPMGITGSVVDRSTGEHVPGLVIRVRGTAMSVQCDTNGRFFLSVPEPLMGKPVTLDVLDGDRLLKSIPLSAQAVPCCVPVSLAPEELPTRTTQASECQDAGTIRLQERLMMMGDISISPEPARSDTLERILRPVKNALRKRTP